MPTETLTFAEQPELFLELVRLVFERRRREEVAPQDLRDLSQQLIEAEEHLWLNAKLNGSNASHLQNLAEIAALALAGAHALVIGVMSEAEIYNALANARLDAVCAGVADEALKTPVAGNAPVDGPETGSRHFAGLRGAGTGPSATGLNPQNPAAPDRQEATAQ